MIVRILSVLQLFIIAYFAEKFNAQMNKITHTQMNKITHFTRLMRTESVMTEMMCHESESQLHIIKIITQQRNE